MLQEDSGKIKEKTHNLRRAIESLREELEAIQYYQERADACSDNKLKKILMHNRDEEKEHAAMLIEWIRQNDPEFGKEVSDYVGKGGNVVDGHKKH